MENKEFKSVFDQVAKSNGFEKAFGGWFKESTECIVVLNLQKSNFGDHFDLNIKVYIQGVLGNVYKRSKDLIKDIGDYFRRQPPEFNSLFDLSQPMDDAFRNQELLRLFNEFLIPFANKASSRLGVKEMDAKGEISLLPAVKESLMQLD